MNNDVEIEGRPRPLSTGLWTLFSWLRRDDRSDSSESLSSAGSDRTVASFAFLTPAHYRTARIPVVLPPPGPPTDSYKKRVHDRNIRRQHDHDITLHRKYGLFKSADSGCGYDALSLPPVRRITSESGGRWDRDRRATSECFQRRLAHVPGKRRAPLPPVAEVPSAPPTSLTRRSTRKRRAPQPPVKVTDKNKENLKSPEENTFITQMNPQSLDEKQKSRNSDVSMGCKSEKYSKKEAYTKDAKLKSEKSFLKQIFDGKKRNSAIDISSVKLLPSISELDKQAAEIIENCKLNASEQNNNIKNAILAKTDIQNTTQSEAWICVSCLRKYNASIVSCSYCLSNQKVKPSNPGNDKCTTLNASSSSTQTEKNISNSASKNKNTAEEKQKLKEMLKEMKDSLPKRPKHDLNDKLRIKAVSTSTTRENSSYPTETPTLRMGCLNQPSTSDNNFKSKLETISSNGRPSPIVTQSVTALHVIPSYKQVQNSVNIVNKDTNNTKESPHPLNTEKTEEAKTVLEISDQFKSKKDLHTPLRISSLLNPVYVPKKNIASKPENTNTLQTKTQTEIKKVIGATFGNSSTVSQHSGTTNDVLAGPSTSQVSRVPVIVSKVETKSEIVKDASGTEPSVLSKSTYLTPLVEKETVAELNNKNNNGLITSAAKSQDTNNNPDQHLRRRVLIHQLEQSIAKGDERAAAEAASKLAQLRLSCSVLSFSSQILSQPSTSMSNTGIEADKIRPNQIPSKINASCNIKEQSSPRLSSLKEESPQKELVNKMTPNSTSAQTNVITSRKVLATNEKKTTPEAKQEDLATNPAMTTIAVLVEDREATRGPVHLRINRQALMRDLRREAETTLGLPINLQRWIVGRALCANDNVSIISLAGPDFSAPFYLCVVESEKKSEQAPRIKQIQVTKDDKTNPQTKAGDVYTELIQLEQQALVPNAENFECGVCMEQYPPGGGVVLRECVHIFCKDCLSDVVRHCGEPNVPCPAIGCQDMLQEREIRALMTPQDYERWLARGLAAAESGTRNAFHCRTRDCKGWALCEPGVQKFPCPICKKINCIPCQAIHDGVTCEQHRTKLKQADPGTSTSETDDGTRTLLNSLIAKGEALECPECSAIITKKWGCDWVKCSACKTEICWVTRGRRWGPGGKGDTSGGCRCGVDGKRCHPSCGYCH